MQQIQGGCIPDRRPTSGRFSISTAVFRITQGVLKWVSTLCCMSEDRIKGRQVVYRTLDATDEQQNIHAEQCEALTSPSRRW